MLVEPVVLPADLTPDEARARLSQLTDDALVVVRREDRGRTHFYAFRAGQILEALVVGAPTILVALRLHEWTATPTVDLRDAPRDAATRGNRVVTDGDAVVGVLVPAGRPGGDRGVPVGRDPGGTTGFEDYGVSGEDEVDDATPREGSLFRAFPRIEADGSVAPGVPFELRFGLSAEGAPGATPLLVVPQEEENEPVPFTVSVLGFGFDFPQGIRTELLADRADVGRATASLMAVAQPVSTRVVRVLEASYEYRGNVVGRAWREVVVVPAVEPEAAEPPPPVAPRSGGTGIGTPPDVPAPHLTVEIHSRQGDGELEWLLHTRYAEISLPTERLTTTLTEGSAKEFALQLMAQVPGASGSPLLEPTVIGIGRRVAAAMPAEFWDLFVQVWQRAKAAGEVPSLLVLTNEPYVPWELAWVGDDILPADELPANASGSPGLPLGSACRVGRWVPPVTRTPRGGDRPATPPPAHLDVTAMAVVIGDYASDTSVRPLPMAEEEGRAIALTYGGMPLTATEADVVRLLQNRLERDGRAFAPTAVHIAAHGEVEPGMQQYSGIILSASSRRLDPIVVQGSELTRRTHPFVFLNACQVGTAGAFLSEYGGMPGAFLAEGCTAYVAPLWNVDDTVAKNFATEFYRAVLDGGTPVAEALRTLRGRFGTDWAGGTATPLAYVFYGHPELSLARA